MKAFDKRELFEPAHLSASELAEVTGGEAPARGFAQEVSTDRANCLRFTRAVAHGYGLRFLPGKPEPMTGYNLFTQSGGVGRAGMQDGQCKIEFHLP